MNYYNEFDPKSAAWLRELIKQGLIPDGWVDERSICDVRPDELARYTQQHFFAGIGGWALALRLAGWPETRPVRTGSCPCQPFSAAGLQKGTADSRHLWPVFRDLITFGEATVTFGEQVASALGRDWLCGVRADLEGLGYAVGAADLCAAGVGAPHIRQRLYWLADPASKRHAARNGVAGVESGRTRSRAAALRHSDASRMAYADGWNGRNGNVQRGGQHGQQPEDGCNGRLEHTSSNGRRAESSGRGASSGCGVIGMGDANEPRPQGRHERGNGANERFAWASSVVLPCTDGKARRIESGSFPLAHGVSGRVGLLRGYGNAIVPQVAAEFIEAYLDCLT